MESWFCIEGWNRNHCLLDDSDPIKLTFYCGRKVRKEFCVSVSKEDIDDKNTCRVCYFVSHATNVVSCGDEIKLEIGDIIKCPVEVAETGFVRVISKQDSSGNLLQPGVEDWDYIVETFDPKDPKIFRLGYGYRVKKEEIRKWSK